MTTTPGDGAAPRGLMSAADELDALDGGPEGVAPTEAAEGSALGSLRARREKARERLYFDLEVPRYDPPLYVRFKPVPARVIDQTLKRTAKMRDKGNRSVLANALILADACLGIFEVVDGKAVSADPDNRSEDPSDWPKFDDRLAALLGIRAGKQTEVVMATYLTDGDLVSTADALQERSGYMQEQLDREGAEGN